MKTEQKTVKRGDLFYTSWGYDQTNYDYIAVLEISKSGKSAKCQRTQSLHKGTSHQCNEQEPVFCPFGDVFTMKIKEGYRGDIVLRGSYPFCNDGSMRHKRLATFWRQTEGQTHFETMSQFGH